jgi:methylase of polypeptide subunit release factors
VTIKAFTSTRLRHYFEGFEAYDESETDFYDRLAQNYPGSILELGCGTGQIVVDQREGRFRFTTPNEVGVICRLSALKMVRCHAGLHGGDFLPEISNSDWVIYVMQRVDGDK